MRGFTSSLNLSVATALVLSRIFDWYPHFVGDLDESELRDLREEWRPRIAPTPAARAQLGGWLDAPETIPLDDARGDRIVEISGRRFGSERTPARSGDMMPQSVVETCV